MDDPRGRLTRDGIRIYEPDDFAGMHAAGRLAAEILDELGSDRVGLQFDSYHAQSIHGDAVDVFRTYSRLIRHIQIGDAPGRCVPGQGSVDFAGLFDAIRASGYSGWVSAAYTPSAETGSSLGWLAAARG